MRSLLTFCTLAITTFLLTACSSSDGRVVVKGRLIEGDKPFVVDTSKLKLPPGATSLPPGSNPVTVTLIAVEGGDIQQTTYDAATSTFTAAGSDGKGIKPGKYKVVVLVSAGMGSADMLKGKYSADKTTLIKEFKAGETVDVDIKP